MSVELTNITQSRCNVPFNTGDEPKHTLEPGEIRVIDDSYLLALNEEAQVRFLSVTTGDSPLFKLRQLEDVIAKAKADTAAADARRAKKGK